LLDFVGAFPHFFIVTPSQGSHAVLEVLKKYWIVKSVLRP